MKQLCIFDLDGTLLDTLADLAVSCNSALAELSLPTHPLDAYRFFVGKGMRALVEAIVPPGSRTSVVDDCAERFTAHYQKNWRARTQAYPGIVEMLKRLAEADVGLAVLSNKPHEFTTLCVRHFFPAVDFLRVFGLRDGYRRKPEPTSALELAQLAGLAPEQCFFIGDSAIDIACGANAGMKTIGVTWGFRGLAGLKDSPTWRLASVPDQVYRLVTGETT
ncbi:MAG: HAD family hydrolase [Desulfobulbaceae bacterium]|jgi:phosphoglycolate phosphatase|nr:HAD family hydrolase [Desulfobulbaceae bacterium]